jgi:hypothetical protein
MASRLRPFLFFLTVALAASNLSWLEAAAAAGLDRKSEAEAKEATRLYKQGQYEEAASLFAKLTVDHPDMPIFERSLGACFYYLHRPEPALSNLRNYLQHRKDVPADDQAVVQGWIEEMEKLAAERNATATPVPAAAASATQEAPAKPAGLDLSAQPADQGGAPRPIYKSWWFWTGAAAVVAAGVVTTILVVNRSSEPCDGAAFPCRGVN